MDRVSPPRQSEVWKTPLYEQYWRLKDSASGCLLFFRLGDFYELFGEDALTAAPLLEVQLTSRDKNSEQPIPMCGVPAHAVDAYAEKLLAKGHRVALAEQVTEAGKSKLVEREILRILTPGLPVDFSRMESKEAHWLMSLGGSRARPQVELLDFLAGTLYSGQLADLSAWEELCMRVKPREILVPAAWESLFVRREGAASPASVTPWTGEDARENLESYIGYTQRWDLPTVRQWLPEARDLGVLTGRGAGPYAQIPANVFEHWAVFPELFDLLDGCGSAVGSRKLREILSSPLREADRIRVRQEAFSSLRSASPEILAHARMVYDFERILGRFRVGVAAPRELLRFLQSFQEALEVLSHAALEQVTWKKLLSQEGLEERNRVLAGLLPLKKRLEQALNSEVEATRQTQLTELLKTGFDAEFDHLRSLQNSAAEWLAEYEAGLRTRTGISSLKVRYNRVFGHYIEVTKTHLEKVPADFERKQTTVSGERFTSPELRAKETEILTAGTRAEHKAREILTALQNEILAVDTALRAFVAHFAWADAVAGMWSRVERAQRFGPWVRPELEEGNFFFSLQDARHPILEDLNGSFVPNSLELGGAAAPLLVLTGPNMAGKSTLMRQTGLCLLLAQCGFSVPATRMRWSPCSGFYSRMGATDRILQGESTFMVEMKETAALLRSADTQSFILLDEIGRGTSTQDGLSIAQAVLQYLHDEVGAVCIFATHYHELSQVALTLPRAVNGSMALKEWKGDLVFLRTLVFSPAESSYGIYVAKLAGLPRAILTQAQKIFLKLSEQEMHRESSQMSLDLEGARRPQVSLPVQEDPRLEWIEQLKTELGHMPLEEMTPKQAWLALESLQEQLREYQKCSLSEGILNELSS